MFNISKKKVFSVLRKTITFMIFMSIAFLLLLLFKGNIESIVSISSYKLTEYNKDNYEDLKFYYYFMDLLFFIVLLYISFFIYKIYNKSKEGISISKIFSLIFLNIIFTILIIFQIFYGMVYFKTLYSLLLLLNTQQDFIPEGAWVILVWWSFLYFISIFLIFKFNKLFIKEQSESKKSFKRKAFVFFIVCYNIFVLNGSGFIKYSTRSVLDYERNRFSQIFVPHGASFEPLDDSIFK
jgi:hypothetical protein